MLRPRIPSTHVAEHSGPAAILRVLKLHQQTVGIGEVQLGRSFFGAAAVDGLSRLQTYRMVIMPLVGPSLATTAILVFIFAWNEFMFALTFMSVETQKTVTVGVATLSGAFTYQIPWGQIAAGVIASSLPLIILLVLFQRKIVAGLTAGAVK